MGVALTVTGGTAVRNDQTPSGAGADVFIANLGTPSAVLNLSDVQKGESWSYAANLTASTDFDLTALVGERNRTVTFARVMYFEINLIGAIPVAYCKVGGAGTGGNGFLGPFDDRSHTVRATSGLTLRAGDLNGGDTNWVVSGTSKILRIVPFDGTGSPSVPVQILIVGVKP